MTNTIAFLIDKEEFKPAELRLMKRLFKKGDITNLLRYERKILEYFWKITQQGVVIEVLDLKPNEAIKQLALEVD
tara:strand:+ start:881 stop:1105 length:225 start_codon:yes stop_codon:yes gene_type:complete